MALHRLDNEARGFGSNCFVCDPSNEHGLRLAFFHDDEAEMVTAELRLDDAFSGTPSYVHGGVTLAVMDEAMAWAVIAMAKVFAVTRTLSATFVQPVRVGGAYRVEARLTGAASGPELDTAALLRDAHGRPCVRARATFSAMTREQAASAIGPMAGVDAGYVRGSGSSPGDSTSAADGPTAPP